MVARIAEKLEVGDIAVYPAHGAGVIEGIERKVVSGSDQRFYIMRILLSGAKIMIPTGNVESVGMRSPISSEEVDQVYRVLESKDSSAPSADLSETWNRRYRRYKLTTTTGSALEVAEILRELHHTKETRELSTGERIIVLTAMNLLVGEVMCAKHMEEEATRQEIELLLEAS